MDRLMLKAAFWPGESVLSSSDLWCGRVLLESTLRFEFRQQVEGDLIPISLISAAAFSTTNAGIGAKNSQAGASCKL